MIFSGKSIFRGVFTSLGVLSLLCFVHAETVGLFFDPNSGPLSFAAKEAKEALISGGYTVESKNISELSETYNSKKIVFALLSNQAAKSLLVKQGATVPNSLSEQALALRTTNTPQVSYWAFGSDSVGAMYAGFQIAENIRFYGYGGIYNLEESPTMLKRGVKVNLPLDVRLPTYGGVDKDNGAYVPSGLSAEKAIPHVWDMNFWKTWIDEQAKHRYNVLSVWTSHPFPALVSVPGYEKASLPYIEGFNGLKFPDLTLDKRKAFWKEVMNYAHSRGMEFQFYIWSIEPDYAKDQYNDITDSYTNNKTIDYMSKSMSELLKQYPELDGIGICACDNIGGTNAASAAKWTWDAYGQAISNYAKSTNKKMTIVHRGLKTTLDELKKNWQPLISQNKFNFDYEVKYANAHMYGVPSPDWYSSDKKAALDAKQKTWMTIRNDDYFYLDWGDPNFVREYIDNFPDKSLFYGFTIGADLYQPTRAFLVKDSKLANQLEVQRNWYIQMVWGRIAYNRNIKDDVFINTMAKRFGLGSGVNLFNAWAKASRPLPKITELMGDEWKLDLHWYPEASWGRLPRSGEPDIEGFKTTKLMVNYDIAAGSKLCPLEVSAKEKCPAGQKNAYTLANEMLADATSALGLINTVSPNSTYPELDIKIKNVKQMGYLGNYFATKIQAATYYLADSLKGIKNSPKAIEAAGKSYCWWKTYASSMNDMYYAVKFRMHYFDTQGKNWLYAEQATLDDYRSLAGSNASAPDCKTLITANSPVQFQEKLMSIQRLNSSEVQISLNHEAKLKISIYNGAGKKIWENPMYRGAQGSHVIPLNQKMGTGLYIVQLKVLGSSETLQQKFFLNKANQ